MKAYSKVGVASIALACAVGGAVALAAETALQPVAKPAAYCGEKSGMPEA
ncbi:MAG: hypothetical protein WAL59_29050 [Roseiarcus sp.]